MATFRVTITTEFPGAATQNVLTLQAGVSGDNISDAWTLAPRLWGTRLQ
ncbi:MAG: hypothetical protein WAK89_20060 [Candidatus Sulfotelmatobacter sp.]